MNMEDNEPEERLKTCEYIRLERVGTLELTFNLLIWIDREGYEYKYVHILSNNLKVFINEKHRTYSSH